MSVGKATLFQEKPGRPDHAEIPNTWKGIKFGGDTVIVDGKKVPILEFIEPGFEPPGYSKSRSPLKRVADLSDDGKITHPEKGKSYILVNKKKVWISSLLLPKINTAENDWQQLKSKTLDRPNIPKELLDAAHNLQALIMFRLGAGSFTAFSSMMRPLKSDFSPEFEKFLKANQDKYKDYNRIRLKILEREFQRSRSRL